MATDEISNPITVGAIGTGARGLHLANHLDDQPGTDVIAVADVDAAARNRAIDELDIDPSKAFEDYRALLDLPDIDAVTISTPHTFHYEQLCAAFDAGVHVLCEKPLTTNRADARDIVQRSRARDEVLMLGYQRHLHPAFLSARTYLREHDVEPRSITAEITQPWLQSFGETWRANPDLSSGGHLYDVGTHVIDAILFTTGLTPTSVSASMSFNDVDERVDTEYAISIEFENGAIASVSGTGTAPAVYERLDIWGSNGVSVDGTGWVDRTVTATEGDGTRRTIHAPEDGESNLLPKKAATFIELIREGTATPIPATAQDGLETTCIVEAAYESARTGQRVTVSLDE